MDIIEQLRTRATIRRQISTRKSVQENKPDRIADLLEAAANEIEALRQDNDDLEECLKDSDTHTSCGGL